MKVYRILGIEIAAPEAGMWHDSTEGQPGWGISLKIFAGWLYRPVLKPKHWGRWVSGQMNPWKSLRADLWVWRLPMIGPFVAVGLGRAGLYLGFKPFKLGHPDYVGWARETEGEALALSASIRRSRLV